jgi:periplasmic divalent cation tolerance protein
MVRRTDARVVLVSCGSLPEARKIAKAVLKKKLAACVNLISTPVESVYWWKGRVERAKEFLLTIKSTSRRVKELEKVIAQLHSYDLPEFLVIEIKGGSKKYLKWLGDATSPARH